MRQLYYGNGHMTLGPYTGTDLRAMAFGRRWLALPASGGPDIYVTRATSMEHARSKLARTYRLHPATLQEIERSVS